MSRETVLSLLLAHPGEYLSGAAMSRTLGVSRAAVWKAIESCLYKPCFNQVIDVI